MTLLREGPLARSMMTAGAVEDAYESMRARLERGEVVPVMLGLGGIGPAGQPRHVVERVTLYEKDGRVELRAEVRPCPR